MSSKIFNVNKSNKPNRSAFDLSHEKKLSGKMGQLMPVMCMEVVPGDKFEIDTESMIRFAPMVAPILHRLNSYIHYFYVPNRIIWDGWEKFVTGDEIALPTIQFGGEVFPGSIADLLGLPTRNSAQPSEPVEINDLPFRAFYQIWKDYYIDQNLSTTAKWGGNIVKIIDIDYDDFIKQTDYAPFIGLNQFYRCWEKDYFTSALPWAQKGNPASMAATVSYKEDGSIARYAQNVGFPGLSRDLQTSSTQTGKIQAVNSGDDIVIENLDSVSITVEEMRKATRLQRWLERNARAGSRYVEHLLSHWGVVSSDARLQRAEYIGGGKSPVIISEVLNTTGTDELPQGNMSGHGINVGRTNHASKYCEEHGFIIGIMSILPEPAYQQGLPKLWSRKLNLDFYYPEFAQLGEQPILNQEIFFDSTNRQQNEETFGYQSRYAEYKYQPGTVHGRFKTSLDYWHAGRKFASLPGLNQEFIEANLDDINERIFAVTSPLAENLYIQLYHKVTAIRPMPFFNEPSL